MRNDISESRMAGEQARLFPVLPAKMQEQRATSMLLAIMSCVRPFADVLLSSVGRKLGVHGRIECWTEVVFKPTKRGNKLDKKRPDGLIIFRSGKKEWTALVEAKIGTELLKQEQIEYYLEMAACQNIDAVITISNQLVTSPIQSPVEISKKKLRRKNLFHWSWKFIETQAVLLAGEDRKGFDVEQKYVLKELIRYLEHDHSGVRGFTQMGSKWGELLAAERSGNRLGVKDQVICSTVSDWHQELRELEFKLSTTVSAPVKLHLSRAHKADSDKRFADECKIVAEKHKLTGVYDIPNAASLLELTVDTDARRIICSMTVSAPVEEGKYKQYSSRINWLLKQLTAEYSDDYHIRVFWPGRTRETQASINGLHVDRFVCDSENKGQLPVKFEVFAVYGFAKYAGVKKFIEYLEKVVPDFYGCVGQKLRRHTPPPPKVKSGESDNKDHRNIDDAGNSGETVDQE